MFQKLRKMIEDVRWEDATSPSWWVKFARRQVRLYFYMVRELVRNQCLQQASALTFTTLLSLVPLFAVAFGLFRAFGSLERWEQRGQEAIFSTIFAGALVEGELMHATDAADPGEVDALSRAPSGELLTAARALAASGADGTALLRYVAAASAGADATDVRSGVATLRLSYVQGLRPVLAQMTPEVRAEYIEAAGAQGARAPGKPPPAGASELPDPELLMKGAEQMAARARTGAEAGDDAVAAEHYRSALLASCDAVMAAAWSDSADGLPAAVELHRRTRTELASSLLRAGSRATEQYMAEPESAEAGRLMSDAARHLEEAAFLLPDPTEAHKLLGDVYEHSGATERAAGEYKLALEKRTAQSRGHISLAVVDYIRGFIDKVATAEVGIAGMLFLLITATAMLSTTERTLNKIWKVAERRPFWTRFTSYCTIIWVGPVLFVSAIWMRGVLSQYFQAQVVGLPVVGPLLGLALVWGGRALPFGALWIILVVLYKGLPHTHVRFVNAAWGALLASLLLALAKPLFSFYAVRAFLYGHIYGSLGVVPVFLLWLWLMWMIVLFGAEAAFTTQNIGLLRYHDKLHRASNLFVDRYLAARMMMYVAREFWQSGQPVSADDLADIMKITPEEAADTADKLVKLGLLTPVGQDRDAYHPARDLSKLKLSEVLSIADRYRTESRSTSPDDRPYEDRLEAAFRAAIDSQDQALSGTTFRDLLQECEKELDKYPRGTASEEGQDRPDH